ncbi:lytic transglycosylase domain-containing protein [Emticicia fluvialis]|uniref:lytic transglycosylase domain-containing protein n=1 Tax=Emticicia fluvialis TaxID=2974474 RepID=UPI0021669CE3|nr:lytic transglycosylase domain-containing protein [Emticicia fluvialis]
MTLLKKCLVIASFIGCASFTVQAQSVIPKEATLVSSEDTLKEQPVEAFIPSADARKVREGFQKMQKTIPLEYNATVQSFVEYFIYKKPSFTKRMLEKKDFYFPIFEKYLAKYEMPDELKYLSMIESALNPKAVSRAKAVGLWQFMKPTGREHGLRIDEYVDERMDLEKSTDAACRYFRQLYKIFGDWELVLASYNTGPGNLRRAIRRAGNITNYWELHPYLHRDTRTYVPQFTAIMYMMHHADEYGIAGDDSLRMAPREYQTITVDGYVDVEAFSNASGISLDDIQLLNPHLLKDHVPAWSRGLDLRIPAESYAYFEANRNTILEAASKKQGNTMLASNEARTEPGVVIIGGNNSGYAQAESESEEEENVKPERQEDEVRKIKKVKKRYHVVKRGEVLNRIATRYNVEMYDLKVWNHLKSSKILAGQRLVILDDDNEEVTEVERIVKHERKTKNHIENTKPKYHVVQRGDTLWKISQRYGGISIEKLKKLNGLRSNSVKAGQKLKIS